MSEDFRHNPSSPAMILHFRIVISTQSTGSIPSLFGVFIQSRSRCSMNTFLLDSGTTVQNAAFLKERLSMRTFSQYAV